MNIDELARGAAVEARSIAADTVDAPMLLARLHRTRRNRFAASIVAIAVVAVSAVIVTMVARGGGNGAAPPAVSPHASCSPVACSKVHHVVLTVPISFSLPRTFQNGFEQLSLDVVEVYRGDVETTGVTVMENAVPVRNDYSWARDPTAGTSAKSVATWLSTRPFLTHTAIVPTHVAGLAAWRVSGQLRPQAHLRAHKDGGLVAPTFVNTVNHMAYAPNLIGNYTLVNVRGAGLTVIWSWSVNHGPNALVGNQAFIDRLQFR